MAIAAGWSPPRPDSALQPGNPYAASKAAGDLLALAARRTHGQDVVITRGTNTYGPRQTPEKLVPLMILKAHAGEPLPVYGDGQQVRDWLHADDHADGVLAALLRGRPGGVYHIAGDAPRANLDVVHGILGEVGADTSLVTHVEDRPGHDRLYALDDAGTREALGWSPAVSFEEGLAGTVRWYLEHPAWCRAVAGEGLTAFLDANYGARGPA